MDERNNNVIVAMTTNDKQSPVLFPYTGLQRNKRKPTHGVLNSRGLRHNMAYNNTNNRPTTRRQSHYTDE